MRFNFAARSSILAFFSVALLSARILPVHAAGTPQRDLDVRIESHLDFPLDRAHLERGGIQYQSALIPATERAESLADFQRILSLDFPRYWENRGRDAYAVMLGRVAFTTEKPVEFYSARRALDVDRMNRMMPELPAKLDTGGIGHYRSTSTPGCRFTVEYFTREQILALGNQRPELRFAERQHPELGVPDAVVVQHNFDFDRVFGFRTSRGAITLTAHYGLASSRTLLLTWSLAYLHNLPPEFWGGAQLVVDKSRDTTLELIRRLRAE